MKSHELLPMSVGSARLIYPLNFPPEYQTPVETVRAKAESKFLKAIPALLDFESIAGPPSDIKCVKKAFSCFESIVVAFASQCLRCAWQKDMAEEEICLMRTEFVLAASDHVFDTLMPGYWGGRGDEHTFRMYLSERLQYSYEWRKRVDALEELDDDMKGPLGEAWKAVDCKDRRERERAVTYLKLRVLSETGQRLPFAEIYRQAGYKQTVGYEWKRCHQPPNRKAHKIFVKVLTAKWERGTQKRKNFRDFGFKLTPL